MSATKVVEYNGKLYRVSKDARVTSSGIANASSKIYLGKAPKKTSFFDFTVTDNLKRAAKNLGMDIK